MASNSIYQTNGNGKHASRQDITIAGKTLPKSSSSHFITNSTTSNNNGKMDSQPNGYRVAPTKIPTKAEIDYHLENFIMSRKIALNGGNELRIDDKNISLHLSQPFSSSSYNNNNQHQQQQTKPYIHFNETITESTLSAASAHGSSTNVSVVDHHRPQRPHSIAVSSPLNLNTSLNNDLNIATLTRRQKITTPNIVTGSVTNKITTTEAKINPQYCSPINFAQFNHFNGGNRNSPNSGRLSLYAPTSPSQITEANGTNGVKQPPTVPQRRSQSIPRQVMTIGGGGSNGSGGQFQNGIPPNGVMTLNRPRSLDRYSGNMGMQRTTNVPPTTSQHASAMKQSITFHGQQMLNQACYQSEIYDELGAHLKQQQTNKDRPISLFNQQQQQQQPSAGSEMFLENQLRIYQDQLQTIKESMKKYQEQVRILNELKRQQTLERQQKVSAASGGIGGGGVPSSKSDSKLSQNLRLSTTSLNSVMSGDEVQTPSHQLRLFLDNIRNSIKEPSFESNDVSVSSDHESSADVMKQDTTPVVNKLDKKINFHSTMKPNNDDQPKTPSDQLRLFLEAIRHNQTIETHQRPKEKMKMSMSVDNFAMKKNDTFSQVTDNIKLLNQDLEAFNETANVAAANNIAKHMDQILDDFNRMAPIMKSKNPIDFIRKCSEALRKTAEQIRLLNIGGNNSISNDVSIREAVQNLMSQPRNGVQIMDDRMSIFIDIMEQQDKFSQVTARS
jgi:hypothetical protein